MSPVALLLVPFVEMLVLRLEAWRHDRIHARIRRRLAARERAHAATLRSRRP